jgi:hypothetical protein
MTSLSPRLFAAPTRRLELTRAGTSRRRRPGIAIMSE